MNKNTTICPKCGHEFSAEHVLSSKIKLELETEFNNKLKEREQQFNNERAQVQAQLETERKSIDVEKRNIDTKFRIEIEKRLDEEKKKLEQEALESVDKKLKFYEEDNKKKQEELSGLREKEVELLKMQQLVAQKESQMQGEIEKRLMLQKVEFDERAQRASEQAAERFALEKKELEKKIEDNKKLAEEMQRKAHQGSMQLQGEVQELVLESLLIRLYPFDRVEEITKGKQGADCVQTVRNSRQELCGRIVYESKRTQNFGADWIEKLKGDMVRAKADVAVLVTQVLPKDMEAFGEKDGVWICRFGEVASVSFVLREMLVRLNAVRNSQDDKGSKADMLYKYFTSNGFIAKVRLVVENNDRMLEQLQKEKKMLTESWSRREKQIWAAQESLVSVFGEINGISGNVLEGSSAAQGFLDLGD